MGRFLSRLLILWMLVATTAWALPARGLIIKLRPQAESSGAPAGRESPQAVRERISAVAHDAGVSISSVTRIGAGHHLLRFPRPMRDLAIEDAMRRLRLHPQVAAVEPDVLLPLAAVPNDPGFASSQWYLQPPGTAVSGLNMPLAWDRSTGSAGVTVAVVDTGILKTHSELAGRYWPGYDFVSEVEFANDGDGRDADASDPGDWVSSADAHTLTFSQCPVTGSSWHGTFIAGLLAAQTNNADGMAGVSWNGMILPVRVSGKCGAFLSDILDGMRWAAGLSVSGVPDNPNPARIINLSFGGDIACTSSYQDVIDEVGAAGTLVVVAAGNESGALRRPADCRGVLAVAAVQADGLKASYSNYGENVGLSAPGGNGNTTATWIYSLGNSGTTSPGTNAYAYKQGTSFSAPLAAGVASLMLSVNPALTPAQLIDRIKLGTRAHFNDGVSPSCSLSAPYVCNCSTATCGAGLLDGNGALTQAFNPVAIVVPVSSPMTSSTVSLDGHLSAAALGYSLASYAWTQLSGTPLVISNAGSALASVTLPVTAESFVFQLKVTDNLGREGVELLTFTSTATPSGGGGGGGASGWPWGLGLWLLALLAGGRAWRAQRAASTRG